jgi:hypothetical protein
VTERVEDKKKEMDEKEADLETIATDKEIVVHTLENLDFRGTSEGLEEVEGFIESAEDVTEKEFDREDENLEQLQRDSEEHEEDLDDRRESSESDKEKISDASEKVETNDTISELERAKEAASRDIEFLNEQMDRAHTAREESEAVQEKLRDRVHTEKRR